ncbi:MAG: MFS transporter [Erysipelotrichaceae bacterium]|nr:MFS transporter [Erysipelotrichaceae bacterium]MDP3305674.1 MFS transporter [Erysipelotrichaceae bacterium]
MSQEKFRRYFQFLLVVLAAGAIFPVIYLRTNYQETILQVYNMTLPQLNTIYSVLGMVFVVGYFPSGLLSDRFSAKKLLAISLFGTALGGFWFAQVPSYTSVVLIFSMWGFFSVFTFWSSHMKIVKLLAKENEEGRFFGILDGGRGVVEAVLASVAILIFSGILGASLALADKRAALVGVIYMYSAVLLITSILIMIFVEDDKKMLANSDNDAPKFKFSDLKTLFKNKFVYLHGAIIFMGYAVFWTVYYLGGFLETNIGVDPVSVGTVMVVVLWMRPVGGFIGGFLADKFGRTTVQIGALAGAALCLTGVAVLPVATGATVFYGLVVLLGIFLYAIRGTYWSLLGDYKIEAALLGTAIGVISFIGYLPDIILPQYNSFLWATFGGNGGYNAYFISSAVIGLVGVALVFIFGRLVKKEQR